MTESHTLNRLSKNSYNFVGLPRYGLWRHFYKMYSRNGTTGKYAIPNTFKCFNISELVN